MSGGSGSIMRRMLKSAGIQEEDVFFTVATRCYTGKAPVVKQLAKCKPYLMEEIFSVRPKVIIPMGAQSMKTLIEARSIVAMRGSATDATFVSEDGEEFSCEVLPTYAVGIVFREPGKEEFIVNDLKRALGRLTGNSEPEGTEVMIASSLEECYHIRDLLLEAEEFSFDFETNGLDYLASDAQILCASFSNEMGVAYVIPLVGELCRTLWLADEYEEVKEIMRQILESDVPKIATNGKFDCSWAQATLGISVSHFDWDDQLLYAMIHEERPHNLEHMRTLFTNMKRYEDFKDTDQYKELLPIWGYACYPEETLWQYAGADADCEFRIAQKLRPLIVKESKGAKSVFS